MTKMTPSNSICFTPSDLHKIHKVVSDDVKTLYAFKQDVRAYAGNLIRGITLQRNVGVDLRAENYKYFCLSDTLISPKS